MIDDSRGSLFAKHQVQSPVTPKTRGAWAKNIVMITSGKGGVGKSTLTVNLASVVAQRDWRVGILDADVYGPSIPRMLGLEDERLRWNENNRIECAENYGIKLMSVGMTTPSHDTPLIWRSTVATHAIIQLIDDVDWGEIDLLFVDMPPGTGDLQLTIAQELNVTAAVVVTTPQKVSTDDVGRAIRMLQEVKIPIGGVIENMSAYVDRQTGIRHAIFGEGGGEMLAQKYGIPLLGSIPIDPLIAASADAGKPATIAGTADQRRPFESAVDRLLEAATFRLPTDNP